MPETTCVRLDFQSEFSQQKTCARCGSKLIEILREPEFPHYSETRCSECGQFVRWNSHPDNVKRQRDRLALIQKLLELSTVSPWERSFLLNIRELRKLSPKQQQTLDKIAANNL